MDEDRCPPIIKNKLAIHVSFNTKIVQYAMENWENSHNFYKKEGKNGAYYYKDSIYNNLGL